MTEQTTLTKTKLQKLTVRCIDRRTYVETLVQLGSIGAKLSPGTMPKLTLPFQAELVLEIEDPTQALKSTPHIIAYPVDYEVYTRSELETMVWPDFREAVATQGVKGRDREKMLTEYLEVVKRK